MEHFVTLARRVKRPALLLDFIITVLGGDPPVEVIDAANAGTGALAPITKNSLYQWVRETVSKGQAKRLERGAERIVLLCDECGSEVVRSLLTSDEMAESPDKFTRALYLF